MGNIFERIGNISSDLSDLGDNTISTLKSRFDRIGNMALDYILTKNQTLYKAKCMSGRVSNEVNGQTIFPNDAEKWDVPNNPGKYTIAIKVRRNIEEQYCTNAFATNQSGKWTEQEAEMMNDVGSEWAESEQIYEGSAMCPEFNEEIIVREDPDNGRLYWMSSTGVNMMNMLGIMGEGGTLAGLFSGATAQPLGQHSADVDDTSGAETNE
jgi:hypothetical protein